ncbi:putative iron-sulfur protein [Gordonia effusa NBRC 100432]|uniref:Cytochrome bc1 complex Rieske iron-sulfur subunit n=1 Tax=Gordonia effusa NBRC 100432 TaxID=1077974 RepID=H0R1R0_9ACTN|nr:Rieske (2Fe-2S) protein [Gordonia effusa]GAB19011.1 putative iron-sulfur protein [Gordonia effusa NBRC 100432]
MDDQPTVTRRRFVAGTGVAVGVTAVALAVSSCGSDDSESTTTSDTQASPPSTSAAAGVLAPLADVPVGGGIIVGDTVLTQATAGKVAGFSATCTHSGCKLSGVTDGKIDCPCHGSKFNLDGTVANGPAKTSLPAVAVQVTGGNVVKA